MRFEPSYLPAGIGCELMFGVQRDGFTITGRCGTCLSKLTPPRRSWCSDACRDVFTDNHFFNFARHRMLERAAVWDIKFTPYTYSLPGGGWEEYRAPYSPGYACSGCGSIAREVEVNHVIPANGRHGKASCIHHLGNLEVLCVPCHRAVTREQARERAAARRRERGHFPMFNLAGSSPLEVPA